MDYMAKTLTYYSKWLGKEEILLRDTEEIQYIFSSERNEPQYGYGQAFDLYIFMRSKNIVVSYGNKAKEKIGELKKKMNDRMSADEIKILINKIYGKKPKSSVKYVLGNTQPADDKAKILNEDHYKNYAEFFKKCNPDCKNTEWLEEYFFDMCREKTCVGAFDGEILISCTDAPGMPYMSDEVQEIGVNTLPEYRGKGHAASVCRKCIYEILHNGKVPQWSASSDNIASQKLAEKVGFVKLADVITLTL